MKPIFSPLVVGMLFCTTVLVTAGRAQEAAEQVFTDWQIVCDDTKPCRMSQTIAQPSTSTVILQARVFGGESPTLLLTFPLGILLSTGWSYRIDNGRETVTPFEICNTDGCHAGVPLDVDLLQRLRRGNQLLITFRDAANAPVTPAISLLGFTKAFEVLQ